MVRKQETERSTYRSAFCRSVSMGHTCGPAWVSYCVVVRVGRVNGWSDLDALGRRHDGDEHSHSLASLANLGAERTKPAKSTQAHLVTSTQTQGVDKKIK
jgi:hypothetical protein